MPSIDQMGSSMQAWKNRILSLSAGILSNATFFGAEIMREKIRYGSPTGSPWHDRKNAENGFPAGSRFGNTNAAFDRRVHPDSGRMYENVNNGTKTKNDGNVMSSTFGWRDKVKYFAEQDSGSYGDDGVGMGLINAVESPGAGVLGDYIAAHEASKTFTDEMRRAGFSVRGNSEWRDN